MLLHLLLHRLAHRFQRVGVVAHILDCLVHLGHQVDVRHLHLDLAVIFQRIGVAAVLVFVVADFVDPLVLLIQLPQIFDIHKAVVGGFVSHTGIRHQNAGHIDVPGDRGVFWIAIFVKFLRLQLQGHLVVERVHKRVRHVAVLVRDGADPIVAPAALGILKIIGGLIAKKDVDLLFKVGACCQQLPLFRLITKV